MSKIDKDIFDNFVTGSFVIQCATLEQWRSVVDELGKYDNVECLLDDGHYNYGSDCIRIRMRVAYHGKEEVYLDMGEDVVPYDDILETENQDTVKPRIVTHIEDLKEDLVNPFGLIGRLTTKHYSIYDTVNEYGIPQGTFKKFNLSTHTVKELVLKLQKLGFYVEYLPPIQEEPIPMEIKPAIIKSLADLNGMDNGSFVINRFDYGDDVVIQIRIKRNNRLVYESAIGDTEEALKDLVVFGFGQFEIEEQKKPVQKLVFGGQDIATFDGEAVEFLHEAFNIQKRDVEAEVLWDMTVSMAKMQGLIMSLPVEIISIP